MGISKKNHLKRAYEKNFAETEIATQSTSNGSEKTLFDMFEVSAIVGETLELTNTFNDEIVYPVCIPQEFYGLIFPGQVFLLKLIQLRGYWQILFISPPYNN